MKKQTFVFFRNDSWGFGRKVSRDGLRLLRKYHMSSRRTNELQAAMIIATIGSIGNFESAAKLKSYFGWAPIREQTGITFDRTHLTQGGVRTMKKIMFLLTWTAIRTETEWAMLYHRLVPRLCHFDERTQAYRGKGKVFGHIAGRLITQRGFSPQFLLSD